MPGQDDAQVEGVAATERNRPTLKGKSKARWEKILLSAAQRFYDDGYEATSIRDVANDASINKGSLYYYIGSKEDLLLGVIQHVHEHGLTVVDTTRQFSGSAPERLRFFLTEHTLYQARNAVEAAVFDRESRHLSDETLEPIMVQRDAYQRYLEELLLAAHAESPLQFWGDERTTAIALLAMTNSLHAWYKPDGPITPEQMVDYVVDFALRGLRLAGDATA